MAAPLYCTRGHNNLAGSQFCSQCGEKLLHPVPGIGQPGQLLGDRYRILRQLGQGGFGRTYLVEDTNRFNEACVLKEFVPQVEGAESLRKAEELFSREAGVLYQLKHPQIPRFRELFRVDMGTKGRLFLVLDYIEGQTYRALLETFKQQRRPFSEADASQLLRQILPVLTYIHQLGVIHRDITPDNLILRARDGLPVLIDFGGVKQIAAVVSARLSNQPVAVTPATRLGKPGYAPPEQMQQGLVYPHSDLYSLAATIVVLLTGQEPAVLIDPQTLDWNWRREVAATGQTLRTRLGAVLDRMLAPRLSDRYQSAQEALQVLSGSLPPPASALAPPSAAMTQSSNASAQGTMAVAVVRQGTVVSSEHGRNSLTTAPSPTSMPTRSRTFVRLIGCAIGLVLIPLAGMGGWWAGKAWLQVVSESEAPATEPVSSPDSPSLDAVSESKPHYSRKERERKAILSERRQAAGIDSLFFSDLVNEAFWAKYPSEQGRLLSDRSQDRQWRQRWDETATELLDLLIDLSPSARQKLGQYGQTDRDRAKTIVNQLHLSSSALNDLTDASFFRLFPKQRNQKFLDQPMGQIWHAIAADHLNDIQSGVSLETLQFLPGETTLTPAGTLQPGSGKAYIAELSPGQRLTLSLETEAPQTLLSIYTPLGRTGPLLEDSRDRVWIGILPERGFYEFVIVSNAETPIDYQLQLALE